MIKKILITELKKYKFLFFLICFGASVSCNNQKPTEIVVDDASYIHLCQKKLTEIIVKDIFSPPVASRIYVYPFLAAYEAGRFSEDESKSIISQLKGFNKFAFPEKGRTYNFTVAAVKAFCMTSKKLIFSVEEMDAFEKQQLAELKKNTDDKTFERSLRFGEKIAEIIIQRIYTDNYKETRGMERFEVKNQQGRWMPTLPDYADAVEPHWSKIKTLVLDSATIFRHDLPLKYNLDKKSEFWNQISEVYNSVNTITAEQDIIVRFWDDNPFVSRTKGHLMFQDKKMTPGGHWLSICRIIGESKKLNFFDTIKAYSLTSIAIFEAFISCWDEKYYTNFVRPETVILENLDPNWKPYLITPSFPSYTSGHSTVSSSAATILSKIFGENFRYIDSTEKEYGLPIRNFQSFSQAAKEASESRIYAGIHYRMDCENGIIQGKKVGNYVLERIKL